MMRVKCGVTPVKCCEHRLRTAFAVKYVLFSTIRRSGGVLRARLSSMKMSETGNLSTRSPVLLYTVVTRESRYGDHKDRASEVVALTPSHMNLTPHRRSFFAALTKTSSMYFVEYALSDEIKVMFQVDTAAKHHCHQTDGDLLRRIRWSVLIQSEYVARASFVAISFALQQREHQSLLLEYTIQLVQLANSIDLSRPDQNCTSHLSCFLQRSLVLAIATILPSTAQSSSCSFAACWLASGVKVRRRSIFVLVGGLDAEVAREHRERRDADGANLLAHHRDLELET